MQLTRHSDYALRLLLHLAGLGGERASIADVADSQKISRNHLMKITMTLVKAGYVDAVRGRNGGIRLGRQPQDISLGDVVATMEPDCPMVDCASCQLMRQCSIPSALAEARKAFFETLRRYTLADVMTGADRSPGLTDNRLQ